MLNLQTSTIKVVITFHGNYYCNNLNQFLLNIWITGYDLRGDFIVETNKCEATLRWRHRIVDIRLMTDYLIRIYSLRDNQWFLENTTSVGVVAEFTYSRCILRPGRLYMFQIRSNVSLTEPYETFYINSYSRNIILGMYWYISCFKIHFKLTLASIRNTKRNYFLLEYFINRTSTTRKNWSEE